MFNNDVLKDLRMQGDKTQEEVAKYLGITPSSYAHFEKGRRRPNKEIVRKLCELFSVQEAIFYDEKVDKVRELINELINKGIIEEAEDVKDDVANLIIDAVKMDIRMSKLKKEQN